MYTKKRQKRIENTLLNTVNNIRFKKLLREGQIYIRNYSQKRIKAETAYNNKKMSMKSKIEA